MEAFTDGIRKLLVRADRIKDDQGQPLTRDEMERQAAAKRWPMQVGVGANGRTVPFEVTPTLVESLGGERYLHFPVPEQNAVRLDSTSEAQSAAGARMIARVLGEVRAREGQPVQLAIDPAKLHLFEPGSEQAIH